MPKIYIHGAGISRFGKRDEGVRELIAEAIHEAEIDTGTVDALVVGNQAGDTLAGEGLWSAKIADWFCPQVKLAHWVNAGSSSGAAALEYAYYLMQSPRIERVLVVAFEKMTDLSTDEVTSEIRKVLARQDIAEDFTMVKGAAVISRAFLEAGKHTPEDWARVAVKNHLNASLNPYAQFQKEIAFEKVMQSRMIATPLRLFDCSPISDGAAALVLERKEYDLELLTVTSGFTNVPLRKRESLLEFEATRQAAGRAFAATGLNPQDVDIAEIHDAFTPFELIGIEDCGLCPPGESPGWLKAGDFGADGALPVNASGGLKGRGHPVGASGLAQVVEIAKMFRGKSHYDMHQRKLGLSMSIGGLAAQNFVTLLANRNS